MINEAQRLGVAETYYFAKKLAEIRQMNAKAQMEGSDLVINLGIGSPDLPPPNAVIEALALEASKPAVHGYQAYKGIPELNNAFAFWYKHHFNVIVNPETELLPMIGSKEAILHLSMSYLNAGDKVLVPNPGYPAYQMTAKLAGAEVIHFDLEEELGWLPDLKKIEAEVDLSEVKMMWVNYPNMPTGGQSTLPFFEELVDFGRRHNILICHDNPYTFILNDAPVSILQVKGAMDIAVELTSLSKNYNMAGWRIGALCGSQSVIDTVLKFKSNMDSGMFRPLQVAAVAALNLGKPWFDHINGEYAKRRIIALDIMKACGCKSGKIGAGMFVFAKIPDHMKSAAALADKILYEAKVFITPGHIFGSKGDRYLRISLCSPLDQFELALKRIKLALS